MLRRDVWEELARIESDCQAPDWDGYGALPISPETLREVRVLLALLPSSMPTPDIVPEPTGAIGVTWNRRANTFLVVSVEGTGVVWYAARGRKMTWYGTEKLGAALLPQIQQQLLLLAAQ